MPLSLPSPNTPLPDFRDLLARDGFANVVIEDSRFLFVGLRTGGADFTAVRVDLFGIFNNAADSAAVAASAERESESRRAPFSKSGL
jgi:hypothetical protein